MEGGKKDVCRFFLKGQCKNGDRCNYEHPREKAPLARKDPPARLPQEKERPQAEERQEVEIKDPEALQKMRYLAGMKATMRQPCRGCKSKRLLAMISCGCQVFCKTCANKLK
jgi:hypothetical protein